MPYKRGMNWHHKHRLEVSELAAPIIVFESPDMPDEPSRTTVSQDRDFEEAVRNEAVRRQKEAEANSKYQKPDALPQVEVSAFVTGERFGEWLAKQEQLKQEEASEEFLDEVEFETAA